MPLNAADFNTWIQSIADQMAQDLTPQPSSYTAFLEFPELSLNLIGFLDSLDENVANEADPLYSACIFMLDVTVTQLYTLSENGNKSARKLLTQLMNYMAETIEKNKHTISFWLPVLNAFYDTHTELTPALKDAYFNLACEEDELTEEEEQQHLDSMRNLLEEMSDLSTFDIAENFFAQSYAMPPDFFPDLLLDLYNTDTGADVGLLLLLHPDFQVREMILSTLDIILSQVTLSSASLSRLQVIMHWYPEKFHPLFTRWIKEQRKKGVIFMPEITKPKVSYKACEIDGAGSQGLFLHLQQNRKNRLCGVLLKHGKGIKDAWITGIIPAKEIPSYYGEALEENVTLRVISEEYFIMIIQHFLAESIENGNMPDLHLLEIQELLGIQLKPEKLDLDYVIDTIAIQISPFTQTLMQESFQRSGKWYKTRKFTDSWFLESPEIDRLVNACCSFVDGVKICKIGDAMTAVFEEMEKQRKYWLFHFLWTALWAKSGTSKREKTWEDCFFIAYAIHEGQPLDSIPIMEAICRTTVANSVETMQERGTYLN